MSYLEFAEIYDRLMADIPYEDWVDFIKKKIKSRKTILEAACGTGNITRLLAEDSYRITAFDLSKEMLVMAYEKLRRYSNVTILNMSMVDFNIDRTFEAVICCCDGINYLMTDNEVMGFFSKAYKHLSQEGVFIFDYSTVHKLRNQLGNNTIVAEEDEIFLVWENTYDNEEQTCEMTLNFFVADFNGLYKRIEEYQKQKSYESDIIVSMLIEAGFSNIEAFDGYSDRPYESTSERVVFVCKRGE